MIMLSEIRIQDFAIINEVNMQFAPGFNVITGETGAGKSILIDAMDIGLGGRAETGVVRTGAEQATIELVFQIPAQIQPAIRAVFEEHQVEFSSLAEITLRREVRANGRSTAKVGGENCKLAFYRALGDLLVDIHGQTEHLSLLQAKSHLFLLDRFAELEDDRLDFEQNYRALNKIRSTIKMLQEDERNKELRIDTLKYQIQEIETARLKVGEEEALNEESKRLANSTKLMQLSTEAYQNLFGDEDLGGGAVDLLNRASQALEKLAALDDSLSDDSELAETIAVQAEELADSIRHYSEDLEVSPTRLEEVEERLALMTRLKKKYGNSIEKVLKFAEDAQQELEDIESSEERLVELQAEEEKALRSIGEKGSQLSENRRKAGEKLAKLIEAELAHLKMEGAKFAVSITQDEDEDGCYVGDERLAFSRTGIDNLEFVMSANFGEMMKPVAKVASGGETARIMLALKTALSAVDHTPTLIFDEVDQGIGGRLGMLIGEKLWGLSTNHQVFSVTHMPQIAGFADTHFHVSKGVAENRTVTNVITLEPGEERVREIAAMLGSESASAQQNAREIYVAAQTSKQQTTSQQPTLL